MLNKFLSSFVLVSFLNSLAVADINSSVSTLIDDSGTKLSLELGNFSDSDLYCKEIIFNIKFVNSNFSQNIGSVIASIQNVYVSQESNFTVENLHQREIDLFLARHPDAVINQVDINRSCAPANFEQYCEFAPKTIEEQHTLENMMDWSYEFRCDKLESDIGKTLKLIKRDINSLKPITFLTSLRVLNLRKNNVVDVSPLAKLRNLKRLNLSHNPISDISAVTILPEIYSINARRTKLQSLSGHEKGPKLTYIYVDESLEPKKN